MSLASNRFLYGAHIKARSVRVQIAFAIFGVAVGVALLFGSQISSTSLTHSAAELSTTQLVGTSQVQLDARGPEGFSDAVLEAVRRQPGVQSTFPVLERQVNVIGSSGERSVDLIGVEPTALRATIPLLRHFSANLLRHAHGIALPAPLSNEINAGAIVRLQIGARFVNTLVGTTLTPADIGRLVHSPVAVTSIEYAQKLASDKSRLTRIFVRYQPADATATHRALARLAARLNINLNPADFDARVFGVAVSPESESELLFSSIAALVGFMFALNAMLITIPARRKLIEDLREQGATRKRTVQVLLFDASVIGVLACALGLAVGDALSILVFRTQPGYLSFAFPVGNARIVTWQSVVLAVVVGMLASVFGVLWPVRHILARRLQTAHRLTLTPKTQISLLILGVVCSAITTAVLLADARAAVFGNATLIVALGCLLPLLSRAPAETASASRDARGRYPRGNGSRRAPRAADTSPFARGRAPWRRGRLRSRRVPRRRSEPAARPRRLRPRPGLKRRHLDHPPGQLSLLATITFAPLDSGALARIPGSAASACTAAASSIWSTRRLWIIAPVKQLPAASYPQPSYWTRPRPSPRRESARAAGLCSRRPSSQNTTCTSASRSPSPRRTHSHCASRV